jgi:glycosyltransferase involved in cell wall biosynthesis
MKKKILFMVQLPPPVHGASLRNLSLAQSVLLNEHFRIRILALHFVDALNEIGGFSVRKLGRLTKVYGKFLMEIVFQRPDLAYFTITPTGGAFFRDAVFTLALKIFKIKIIYHLRGLGIREASTKSAATRAIYSFVFRGVTVVCIGKNQILDYYSLPVRRFFVVPDGIDSEVNSEDLKISRLPGKPLTILYLSNFVSTKGVYDFLDTLDEIAKMGMDFRARMVGDAADVTAAQLQTRSVQLGLTDKISIEGPVFGKGKFSLFLDADIFFFPTYFELFPGVVLEAMQCAKAILTTHTGCIPEMIDDGENGILVAPRSVHDMAIRLKQLMEDAALRQRLGLNAREKYLREFTLGIYETRMKEVLNQC